MSPFANFSIILHNFTSNLVDIPYFLDLFTSYFLDQFTCQIEQRERAQRNVLIIYSNAGIEKTADFTAPSITQIGKNRTFVILRLTCCTKSNAFEYFSLYFFEISKLQPISAIVDYVFVSLKNSSWMYAEIICNYK